MRGKIYGQSLWNPSTNPPRRRSSKKCQRGGQKTRRRSAERQEFKDKGTIKVESMKGEAGEASVGFRDLEVASVEWLEVEEELKRQSHPGDDTFPVLGSSRQGDSGDICG